jgi:hypothetical protein
MFKNMNNKTTIFIAVGIMVLSLLAMKPLTNQVFAQTNETQTNAANQHTGKCTTELSILAHSTVLDRSGAIGVPTGQTAPVTLHGSLTCGGAPIDGATVTVRVSENCGEGAAGERATTNANGAFSTGDINLGPCPTPYSAQAQFAGDSTHEPATASTGFYIDETK